MSINKKVFEGVPVTITGKLDPDFKQPVFYSKQYDIYYYIIFSTTYVGTLLDNNKSMLVNSSALEDRDRDLEMFSLNSAIVDKIFYQQRKNLFVQIKGPDLDYIKGIKLSPESLEDSEIYVGKLEFMTSRSKYSNHFFTTKKFETLKEK